VTAARKADAIVYEPEFQWRDYPAPLEGETPDVSTTTKLLYVLYSGTGVVFAIIGFAAAILLTWMWIAIDVKRYHDRDRSGWWLLLLLIPVLGPLWLFVVLGFLKGTEGENRFGADPLAADAA
jgi:uncharacterized membrane protein YhaH (DUF805 family)